MMFSSILFSFLFDQQFAILHTRNPHSPKQRTSGAKAEAEATRAVKQIADFILELFGCSYI